MLAFLHEQFDCAKFLRLAIVRKSSGENGKWDVNKQFNKFFFGTLIDNK